MHCKKTKKSINSETSTARRHSEYEAKIIKTTPWNTLRIERGYTLKALADELHVGQSYLSSWIYGYVWPADNIIINIADLFDITVAESYELFKQGYKGAAVHPMPKCCLPDDDISDEESEIVVQDVADIDLPEPMLADANIVIQIFGALYGKIPFEDLVEFIRILNASGTQNINAVVKEIYTSGLMYYADFITMTMALQDMFGKEILCVKSDFEVDADPE